jgi:hypothetical protein
LIFLRHPPPARDEAKRFLVTSRRPMSAKEASTYADRALAADDNGA